jgi:23S rRNA-/tRNA-specific pseudouridylate synthase
MRLNTSLISAADESNTGHPIVGDIKYGAPQRFKSRDIALHAYALTVPHPITAVKVRNVEFNLEHDQR